MNPDDLKQTWKEQSLPTRLTIDAELLLKELQRNQRSFAASIFWRDVLEVGTSLLLIPLWIYLGSRLSLPWTWYLTVPVLVWMAGFLLADRLRHRRRRLEPGEPLRQHVTGSLIEVEHQIWLLRHVFWWYLLPPALSLLAFVGQFGWIARSGGWWTASALAGVVAVLVLVYYGIYRVNQEAVRSELVPRRQELEALLDSLKEET